MIVELPSDLPFVELAQFLARHGYRLQPEGWEGETALFTTVPLAPQQAPANTVALREQWMPWRPPK